MSLNISLKKSLLIFTAIIAWFAIVIQGYFSVQRSYSNGLSTIQGVIHFLSYFTIWINALIAFLLTSCWLKPNSKLSIWFQKPSVNTAVALYILIVAIIYSLLLRNTWNPKGMELIADHILHDLIPALYIIQWIFYFRGPGLHQKHLFYWLILPLIYLIYVLVRGAWVGAYPYPFLKVSALGYQKVLINSGVILIGFILVSLVLFAVDYLLQKRKP